MSAWELHNGNVAYSGARRPLTAVETIDPAKLCAEYVEAYGKDRAFEMMALSYARALTLIANTRALHVSSQKRCAARETGGGEETDAPDTRLQARR